MATSKGRAVRIAEKLGTRYKEGVSASPSSPPPQPWPPERPKYVAPLPPVHFPESAEVPESQLHLELRTLLYLLLKDYLGQAAAVGSDQFIYYDASDPRRVVAPDVYVRLQPQTSKVKAWKVWERGAPELAIELVSDSDESAEAWERKLAHYRAIGVSELVRFDAQDTRSDTSRRLRVWNRVGETLQERLLEGEEAASLVLEGVTWVAAPGDGNDVTLRLRTADGVLVPTLNEARKAEAQARKAEEQARKAEEQARKAEEQARKAEEQARKAAEARIRELEALLKRQAGH